jgi:hypothetical protein
LPYGKKTESPYIWRLATLTLRASRQCPLLTVDAYTCHFLSGEWPYIWRLAHFAARQKDRVAIYMASRNFPTAWHSAMSLAYSRCRHMPFSKLGVAIYMATSIFCRTAKRPSRHIYGDSQLWHCVPVGSDTCLQSMLTHAIVKVASRHIYGD